MYKVYFTDSKGHLFTNHGLTHKIGDGDEFIMKEFSDLNKAKRYAKSFVRRYPEAYASVDEEDKTIAYFENEAYIKCYKRHSENWKYTYKKMNKLFYVMATLIIIVFSFIASIIYRSMAMYNLSFIGSFFIFVLIGSFIILTDRGFGKRR